NNVFGDPVFGVRKACYIRRVSSGQPDYTPPSGYRFCAWENERCSFSGTADVAYGANGQFAYRQGVSGGIDCNNSVFGDPVVGVRKACYTRLTSGGPARCPGQYQAEYFANRNLSGSPVLVRCEGWPIRHDWAGGSPGSGVPDDGFSVRWTGRARIESGIYTFIARADDGIRVRLGGDLIIDAWRDQSPTDYRATRQVSAGEYEVQVEYYENGGGALVEFRWERASASASCSGTAIALEQRVEGLLSDATPSISYCLRVSAGQMISARMFALGNDGLDPYLKVWTADGQLLAENDDGLNIGYSSFLSVRFPQDGVYRIEATRYGGEGRYALRLEAGFQAAVGDLDRDCDVDDADRSRLRGLLGRADPDADLDLDGVVSSRDAMLQMRSLGVRCQ
ncbi:MAG: PA14 domain-containing protein, partial [Anaerolineae bacterium]|nr:PA14 domain-containing protein [Anaerolineae bacterium]